MRGQDSTLIILIVMMMCCSSMSLLAGAGWFVTRPEEGDPCEPNDADAAGVYKVDEDNDCVLDDCVSGYYKSGDQCKMDMSGTVCEPTTDVDAQGRYLTDQSGSCNLVGCNTGYSIVDDACALDEPEENDEGEEDNEA